MSSGFADRSYDDIFFEVTEQQMLGEHAAALRLVTEALRAAESVIRFPWDSNSRYRRLVDLQARLRRQWVSQPAEFNMTGVTSGRFNTSTPRQRNVPRVGAPTTFDASRVRGFAAYETIAFLDFGTIQGEK